MIGSKHTKQTFSSDLSRRRGWPSTLAPWRVKRHHIPISAASKIPTWFVALSWAEILWEDAGAEITSLAHGIALSKRASDQKAVLLAAGRLEEAQRIRTWGGFGHAPLASLLQVLQKKCAKTYQTDGSPVSLLLYYERDSPLEPFEHLIDHAAAVHALLAASQFSDVWLYDHAVGYIFDFSDMPASADVSLRLCNLRPPESPRRVIGHLTMTAPYLAISLDASYSQAWNRASNALVAERDRYSDPDAD